MRHLLTHTSGLGYWTPVTATDAITTAYRTRGVTPGNYGVRLNRPGFGPQAAGLDEMVKRLAELPLFAEPGTAYRYSIGLDVMGLVIERVSGKPLDAFYRERIFAPLKMASSGLQVPASAAPRLTTNYDVTPGGLMPTDRRETSVWLKPPTLAAGGGTGLHGGGLRAVHPDALWRRRDGRRARAEAGNGAARVLEPPAHGGDG